MLILLSPAKSFDFETTVQSGLSSIAEFTTESERLIKKLRSFSAKK